MVEEYKIKEGSLLIFKTKCVVREGEELFFDYGQDYSLEWKSDFDEKV